ncbi:MAG: hypothetical protein ACLQU4_07720 [Limisphaerales bacterium]
MSYAVPVFAPENQTAETVLLKRRRGVTVITQYGRAVAFGVSREMTEDFMKAKAQGKDHEIMAAMQAHKAARLGATQILARKP